MRYGYYPGCSLSRTAKAYDDSTRAISDLLGMELEEIEDWNCCGASEYFSVNRTAAYSLVARNLALASHQNNLDKLVAPCSACYLNLRKTDHYMGKYPEINTITNEALAAGGLSYDPGSIEVRHFFDAVISDVGINEIEKKVTKPLTGLRIAPYYGCYIVRPEFSDESFDNPEYPMHLDELMSSLGATVVDFPLKAHCCGGHMTQISDETAFELIRRLLQNADEYDADIIVTLCPMCQLNLDAYQHQVNRRFNTHFDIPILYFTQMIGLAMGIAPNKLGIGKEIVSSSRALRKIGAEVDAEEVSTTRHRRDDKSLPMPGMRGEG
jgi:heterodisulfide reductase subunit B